MLNTEKRVVRCDSNKSERNDKVNPLFEQIKQWLKTKRNFKQVLLVILITSLGIYLFYLLPFNTQARLEAAEKVIDALYLDENHHYLKRDVTERQVKQIIRQTKRFSGEAQDKLSPIVKLTQEKHHDIQNYWQFMNPLTSTIYLTSKN